MERRDFLKAAALSGAGLTLGGCMEKRYSREEGGRDRASTQLPRRPYGNTGVELSVIGFGGIVVMNAKPDQAARVVAQAVERGVNYFDVAPSYGDAEIQLGPALEPYRKGVFLACKSNRRDRAGAEQEFQTSLERLRTDYFDLYQLHAITNVEKDVDPSFAKGGIMEFLMERKKAGQIRYLGFSAHSTEAALTAMNRFDFDSILFPVNFTNYYQGRFGPTVVAEAEKRGVARLALKALARQKWPKDDPLRQQYPKCWYQPVSSVHEAELALRFTLSQPVTAAIPPGEESLFWLALDFATRFQPLTEIETAQLVALSKGLDPVFMET